MRVIKESGMSFPVDELKSFHIEKSSFVNSLDGMAKCEFISLTKSPEIVFVEAKTSFSKPKNVNDYAENIQEIVRKFNDSVQIVNAILLRHKDKLDNIGVPKVYEHIDRSTIGYRFYLVIKEHKDDWLIPISDDLKSKMKTIFRLWNIPDTSLKVLNEDMARRKGLIK